MDKLDGTLHLSKLSLTRFSNPEARQKLRAVLLGFGISSVQYRVGKFTFDASRTLSLWSRTAFLSDIYIIFWLPVYDAVMRIPRGVANLCRKTMFVRYYIVKEFNDEPSEIRT